MLCQEAGCFANFFALFLFDSISMTSIASFFPLVKG